MVNVTIQDFSYAPTKKSGLILDHVNAQINSQQFTLLTGPSGGGKSTLLKFIAGLYPKYAHLALSGQILLNQQNMADLNRNAVTKMVGMVFQDPDQQFAMDTVQNEIIFILENLQTDPNQIDKILQQVLDFCGIEELKHHSINTLSGGEKQKLALACVLAMDVELIILDEPFANVDPAARLDLINKLKDLQLHHHKTIIVCDHDLNGYENIVDTVLYLDGQSHQLNTLNPTQIHSLFASFKNATNSKLTINLPNKHQSAILELTDFKLQTADKILLALDNFKFYDHQTTLITGANGIGKSTLFKALVKLTNFQGSILFNQVNINKIKPIKYSQQVSLLFQNSEDQFLEITVQEELELSKKMRQNSAFSEDAIQAALEDLNLAHLLKRNVYNLSGGQKKKLQILLMLIMNPPVLLLDEPFSGLDLDSLKVVIRLLQTAKLKFNQTQIIISHQLTNLDQLVDLHVQFSQQTLNYLEVL